MEIHPTEMSQAENDHEEAVFIDQMGERKNDYEEVQRIRSKLREGAKKTESLYSACIYRVPEEIRKLKESAYTPRFIAIGPLHRDDEHLQTSMQDVKMSYMNNLLCRITQGMENQLEAEQKKITVLQECVAAMEMSIEAAKKCYAKEVTLDAEMMLVDGCFILELLYKFYLHRIGNRQGQVRKDPIVGTDFVRISVQYDLLLLENQIPFLALERLFELTLARIPNRPQENLSLTDYVFLTTVTRLMRPTDGNSTHSGSAKSSCWPRDCVLRVLGNKMDNFVPEEKVPSQEVVSSLNAIDYYHILHKLHDDYLPLDQTRKEVLSQIMPSASELAYAGVKFVRGKGNDLFEVKFTEPEGPFRWFRSAHFEIPCLTIYDQLEPFLRNFIAFEQCCPDISQHFTSYAHLMNMLVNSATDVQVLQKAGVLNNRLGASDDVTDLFNNLCKEVIIGQFLFADKCKRATSYSKRFWPKHMAYLRRQYFDSPWTFIAFCLGFVYFGLTIAQLIISIIIK